MVTGKTEASKKLVFTTTLYDSETKLIKPKKEGNITIRKEPYFATFVGLLRDVSLGYIYCIGAPHLFIRLKGC